MQTWTVLGRPPSARRAACTLLVRDGFSWGAALLPVVWFLSSGLVALGALHAAVLVLLLAVLPTPAVPLALAGVQLFVGLEGRGLQAWWLRLRGWREEAVLMARDEDAAFLNLATFRPDLARLAR